MAISNASNQIVKVNLIPGIIPSVLHLSQYDTGAGRPVTFSVYDGSQTFTIPSGVSIAFEGTKPDGNGFSFTCTKSGSNALLTNYTNQMTALPGKIMCQLVFTDTSGGRVGSLPVLMVVTPAGINGDTVISDSDIEAIVAAQNAYAALNARLDAAIDQVNTMTNEAIDQVNTMTNEAIDQMNTTTNKAIDQMNTTTNKAIDQVNTTINEAIDQVNTKANDLQNQYAVTNAKLDTAISAATQDSEVQDIRVKADGTSATTAGNAVREQFTELKNEIDYYTNVEFEVVAGQYINESGLERPSGNLSHSAPISVQKDTVIVFTAKGYNTNVSMISTSNQDGTSFKAKVGCIDNTVRTYTYTVEEDGYIVVSYANNGEHNLTIKGRSSNTALNDRVGIIEDSNVIYLADAVEMEIPAKNMPITVAQDGKYISSTGNISSANPFEYSTEIAIKKGQTITFNAKGYLTSVSVLAASNTNGTYTPLIISEDNDEHIFSYFASYDMNVVISTYKTVASKYTITGSVIGELKAEINALDYVAFATIGVIGDSLASGASNYSGGVTDRPTYSWGKCIEREHGIAVTLFSAGGTTTRSWLTGSFGLTALNNSDPLDCYIIGLGVNDAYSLGDAYLGSVSDVHVGNENENADTYYGNYSKIIAAIKTKSPRAKIFCITNPRGTNATGIAYNEAVEDIVGLYTNTYLIDLRGDSFYTSPEFKSTWYSAHSTAVGYKLIAQNIYNHLNDIIQENVKEFLDIQWIVNNHD